MTRDQQLLATARRMPDAEAMLVHLEWLGDLYAEGLGLTIDRDAWTAPMIERWTRSQDGIGADAVLAASVLESAARPKLTLTHDQRKKMRADISALNRRLNAKWQEMKAEEGAGGNSL